MIRNSFEYMNLTDFDTKYALMIENLDDESIKTVDLFMKHIRLFYHNNVVHESELFSERELRLQEKSVKFMGETWVLHPTGYGIFESPEILASIRDDIILDVGASDGIESMMFAKLLPWNRKIYAFEPSSYNFQRLQNHIQKSPYSGSIFPQQIALGEKDGEVEIFGVSWAEVSLLQYDHTPITSEIVRVMSIDSFVKANSLARVWLIKWDIEWAEIESILGAKETIIRDKPVLVVSIYHNGREFFETKPLLESWNIGYRFKVLQWEPGCTWVGVVLICY